MWQGAVSFDRQTLKIGPFLLFRSVLAANTFSATRWFALSADNT
jgi:hypothetical protein